MHQGVIRGTDIDLTDRTYDGHTDNGRLLGGLGQLADGQKGDDNFREDYSGYGKGESDDCFITRTVLCFQCSLANAFAMRYGCVIISNDFAFILISFFFEYSQVVVRT